VEVWAAVRVAWPEQAERRRLGQRRPRVAEERRARQVRRRERWAVAQARQGQAPEREAAWEQ